MKAPPRSLPVVFALAASTLLSSCGGGGGGGNGDQPDVCSVLKIAGGEECANPPQSIAIVATDRGYCSGAFISPNKVLTAAHCFPPNSGRVLVGARGFSSDAQRYDIHPQYNGDISSPYDIAVVTLVKSNQVTVVPLELSTPPKVGDRVVTYGYGVDQDGDDIVSRVEGGGLPLKATDLEVSGVDSGTVFTKSDGNGDTCQGDSGGPILTDGSNGQPGIVALVRSGPDTCVPDSGFPSENTNIQSESATSFILRIAPNATVN